MIKQLLLLKLYTIPTFIMNIHSFFQNNFPTTYAVVGISFIGLVWLVKRVCRAKKTSSWVSLGNIPYQPLSQHDLDSTEYDTRNHETAPSFELLESTNTQTPSPPSPRSIMFDNSDSNLVGVKGTDNVLMRTMIPEQSVSDNTRLSLRRSTRLAQRQAALEDSSLGSNISKRSKVE